MFRRKIIRSMMRGLVVVLPMALTIYGVVWIVGIFDSVFGKWLVPLLPEGWYIPGMGVVIGVVLVLGVGILADYWLVRTLVTWADEMLESLPLV